MTPDLEEMIRRRAHEIWEQEGRPDGRHEEHWQMAASEMSDELERIKAEHRPATAEQIETPPASRRGRPRRAEAGGAEEEPAKPRARRGSKTASTASADASGNDTATSGEGQQDVPRRRGRKVADEAQSDAAPATASTTRRRAAKGTTGAQSEPAAEGAPTPKTRRKKTETGDASSDAGAGDRPARRGRKPKEAPETIH